MTTTLTIRRPDGTVETIDTTDRMPVINERTFARIVASTRSAGRGEVLRYTSTPVKVTLPRGNPFRRVEAQHHAAREREVFGAAHDADRIAANGGN